MSEFNNVEIEDFHTYVLVSISHMVNTLKFILPTIESPELVVGGELEKYLSDEGYMASVNYIEHTIFYNTKLYNLINYLHTMRDDYFYSIIGKYFPRIDPERYTVAVNVKSCRHIEIRIKKNET